MTKEKATGILALLQENEAFESSVLNIYKDKLYETFRNIYEVEAVISWERVSRFAPESMFIMITGRAIIEKGTELAPNNFANADMTLDISFTIPWDMLDDASTPKEIADMARSLSIIRQMMTPEEYMFFLRDRASTTASINERLAGMYMASTAPADIVIEPPPNPHNYSEFVSGFDLSKLSEDQKESFRLTYKSQVKNVRSRKN